MIRLFFSSQKKEKKSATAYFVFFFEAKNMFDLLSNRLHFFHLLWLFDSVKCHKFDCFTWTLAHIRKCKSPRKKTIDKNVTFVYHRKRDIEPASQTHVDSIHWSVYWKSLKKFSFLLLFIHNRFASRIQNIFYLCLWIHCCDKFKQSGTVCTAQCISLSEVHAFSEKETIWLDMMSCLSSCHGISYRIIECVEKVHESLKN